MKQYVAQCCNSWIPIVGKLQRPKSDRIGILKIRIKAIEEYHLKKNKAIPSDTGINELKQELDYLLKEEEKRREINFKAYLCIVRNAQATNSFVPHVGTRLVT
jgi:hypothetical protein